MRALNVLLLVSAHNSLSQRSWIALTELGHDVEVAVVSGGGDGGGGRGPPAGPDRLPDAQEAHPGVHLVRAPLPGRAPRAARRPRPSSLDWSIELGAEEWGVTVLEADGSSTPARSGRAASSPRGRRGRAPLSPRGPPSAIARSGDDERVADRASRPSRGGRIQAGQRPLMTQEVRAIDWSTDRRDRGPQGARRRGPPRASSTRCRDEFHLFGVHRSASCAARPARSSPPATAAICRATVDGAVWITHLKRRERRGLQAPRHARARARRGRRSTCPRSRRRGCADPVEHTLREIAYEEPRRRLPALRLLQRRDEHRAVPAPARRLPVRPLARQTKVIVLMGGADFFSNGIHLNVIEAADDPARSRG